MIDALIQFLGGPAEAAKKFGLKTPSVCEWSARGQLPVGRVLFAEALTEGKFTRYMLRPDVYGEAPNVDADKAA